jgi:hypothetical protein
MDLKGRGCEGMDWIQLVQDRDSIKFGEFLDQMSNYQLLKNPAL